MCLGSFSDYSKAERQVKTLTENGIEVSIQEYKKSSSEILFRVFTSETLPTRQAAMFQKELLLNHSIIRNLNINDISLVTVEGPKVSNFNTKELDAKIQQMQNELPEAAKMLEDERRHEKELYNMLDEERLHYIGAMVLGLNDALVELTGSSILLLPLHHTFGLVAGLYSVMYYGYPLYINRSLKKLLSDFQSRQSEKRYIYDKGPQTHGSNIKQLNQYHTNTGDTAAV